MADVARVAIVTGGSRGIGRAAALKLGAAGYTVVVNYTSNAAAADAVVKAITAAGGKAVAVKGDVAQEADILALFAAADKLGPLKVLVNNAGVMDQQNRLDEMSTERIRRILDINTFGSILCAREAVKRMSTKHGGTGLDADTVRGTAERHHGTATFDYGEGAFQASVMLCLDA